MTIKTVVEYWRKGNSQQNFGDYLSEFFIEELFFPYRANVRGVHIIGSVLSENFVPDDDDKRDVVFWGCGLRDDTGIFGDARERANILSVRGPLSVSHLAAGALLPVGDPAFLLPALYIPQPASLTAGKPIAIPHFNDRRTDAELQAIAGCDLILRPVTENNTDALRAMIDAIAGAEFVLSSSLHGCVVAAAYGRPFSFWNSGEIDLPFKWQDLAASLNIPCKFSGDLAEARSLYAEEIAPVLRLPDLVPSVIRSPLLLRAGGLAKIIAWHQANSSGPNPWEKGYGELARRQNEIYEGIIEDLTYWVGRTMAAEAAKQSGQVSYPSNGQIADAIARNEALEAENRQLSERLAAQAAELTALAARLDSLPEQAIASVEHAADHRTVEVESKHKI